MSKTTKKELAVKRLQALQWKLDTSDVSNRGEDRALAAAITLMENGRGCPECGAQLTFFGSSVITLHGVDTDGDVVTDTNIDVAVDRYDCEEGHTSYVLDTASVPSRDVDEEGGS